MRTRESSGAKFQPQTNAEERHVAIEEHSRTCSDTRDTRMVATDLTEGNKDIRRQTDEQADDRNNSPRQLNENSNEMTAQIYEAGFKDTNRVNSFRCDICNLGVTNVPLDADPVIEHFRLSPGCQYLFENYQHDLEYYNTLRNILFEEKILDRSLFKNGRLINVGYATNGNARKESFALQSCSLTITEMNDVSKQGFYATGTNTVSCCVCNMQLPIVSLRERFNKNKHQWKCPFKS